MRIQKIMWKPTHYFLLSLTLIILHKPHVSAAQELAELTGTWITIDDITLSPKSLVEVQEVDGKLYGTVVELLKGARFDTCESCSGDLKGKPIIGLQVISGLEPTESEWWDKGRAIDPTSGKTYNCKVRLIADGQKLELRAYKGFSILGRSQTWHRK